MLMFQAELENKLQQQSILSAQELKAEKVKLADLQKSHEKNKENMEKLQLDLYGKESELLAIRQDLKVLTVILTSYVAFSRSFYIHFEVQETVQEL